MKSVLLIFLSLLSIVALVMPSHASSAAGGLGLDGFAGSFGSSITLTTTHPRDMIIIGIIDTFATSSVASVSDTAGLYFGQRTHFSETTGCINATIEEWYARAPKALSSDVITVTTATGRTPFIIGFGIHGSYKLSFDGSPSLPATVVGNLPSPTDCSHQISTTFSTQSSKDFVFALIAINDGIECPGPHFTSLFAPKSSPCGDLVGNADMMYTVTRHAQHHSLASSTGDGTAMVIDAIRLAGQSQDQSEIEGNLES